MPKQAYLRLSDCGKLYTPVSYIMQDKDKLPKAIVLCRLCFSFSWKCVCWFLCVVCWFCWTAAVLWERMWPSVVKSKRIFTRGSVLSSKPCLFSHKLSNWALLTVVLCLVVEFTLIWGWYGIKTIVNFLIWVQLKCFAQWLCVPVLTMEGFLTFLFNQPFALLLCFGLWEKHWGSLQVFHVEY